MRKFLLNEFVSGVCLLTCVVGLRQGDFCTVEETGQPGECLHISQCPVVYEAALKSISPQTCGYNGTVPIVCCPGAIYEGSNCTMKDTGIAGACARFANCRIATAAASEGILPQKCAAGGDLVCCTEPCPPLSRALVSQQRIGSKAADYCIELSEKIFPCQQTRFGWTRGGGCPRLIPDHSVEYNRTPLNTTTEASHYGHLGRGEIDNVQWLWSTVTLLSDRWVVCSAFIIGWIGAENNKFVGLGGSFTPKYTPDAIYSVTRTLLHPEYNGSSTIIHHNIALLQVDRQVTFTSRILPACLHTGFPLPAGGLIHTGRHTPSSADVQTTMEYVPHDECSRVFNNTSWLSGGIQDHLQLCSRLVNTTGGCQGWSDGATLSFPNGARVACTNLLVGTITAVDPPSCTLLYLRMSAYIPWIESIVWP